MNLDTLSSDTMARPQPEVINWSTLPRWARRTLLADQKTYVSTHRPLSLSRLTSAIFPGLRSPIFLIGSPRSGTTFLGQCLASLPNISYHFEPIATKAAARYVYDGTWSNFQSQWFYKNVYQWLLRSHLNGDLNFAETP